MLEPGEEIKLPVSFYIDPDIIDDQFLKIYLKLLYPIPFIKMVIHQFHEFKKYKFTSISFSRS